MKSLKPSDDRFIAAIIKNGFENVRVEEFIDARPDWGYLLENSVKEGVFFPFYSNLLALDPQNRIMPEEFREKYRQTYYLHIAKSAEFTGLTESALKRLDLLKIKILLFKGPATDSLIYDNFCRPRLDLDIAVRDENIFAVQSSTGEPGGPTIHIHRHLINNTFLTDDDSLHIDMERIWPETETFKGYASVVMLKPEINILYLCEHGLKHDFDQLIYLYEIERLIAHYGYKLDWNKLVSMARDFRMERVVYYGLYLVRHMLSGGVSGEALDALRPNKISAAEKIFIKDVMNRSARRYSSYCVYLASREGALGKAKFLLRTAFPQRLTLKDNLTRIGRSILR